jgi:hypothetical protein
LVTFGFNKLKERGIFGISSKDGGCVEEFWLSKFLNDIKQNMIGGDFSFDF